MVNCTSSPSNCRLFL